MATTKTPEAFRKIHEQLDRYESILKMAKIQVKYIMEHRALRHIGNDENLKKNLDTTREFVKCLGHQM